MQRAPWRQRSLGGECLQLFGLYAITAYLAILVARQPGTIAAVWLANGLAIAFIVSSAPSRTAALLCAAAMGNLAANLAIGDPLHISLAFIPPNTIETALGAYLVRRTGHLERFSTDQRAFAWVLCAGSLIAPLLGATLGSATLQALAFGEFERVWIDWYIGSALGSAAVLPLVLAMRSASFERGQSRWMARRAVLAFVAATAVCAWALAFFSFPFVVVTVTLLGAALWMPRLNTFALALTLVCAMAAALAFKWFAPLVPNTPVGHAQVYLSALLVVFAAQMAAVMLARQRMLNQLLIATGSHPDHVMSVVDMSGTLRWASRSREGYLSVPNGQAVGKHLSMTLPSHIYDDVIRPLFEQGRNGASASVQRDVSTPGRGLRTVQLSCYPALDEDGKQAGVVFSSTDITEMERSRRALQQAVAELHASNEGLEQFVRIASHDLREPLNTISQFCGLIHSTQREHLNDATAQYFDHVQRGALRMKTLLDDVLHFVRLGAASPDHASEVDLDDLLSEVLQALQARVREIGAQLELHALGKVKGHRSLLGLALQNLLSNALKFVPSGQRPLVVVRSLVEGQSIRLTVQDNGIGVPAERQAELGTPFKRLHAQRKYPGTGLGLATCKRVAQLHGGRLEVESKPGAGSAFHLVLRLR